MIKRNAILTIGLILLQFSAISQSKKEVIETNFYAPRNSNRTVAEWETAIGTMLVWPLSVPYKLVIELAKDNHLFTLVENDSTKRIAEEWYNKWGIEESSNTFITIPLGVDASWTRDWGPSAVFSESKMKLGDGKYIYSTPATAIDCNDSLIFLYLGKNNEIIKTEIDDNATIPLGKELNLEILDLPFINTGGNVLTDGLGTAFSTCILLNENKFYNLTSEQFFKLNRDLLGINNYNIISNFERMGIQHIDCFMKLLDEERILVAEPPPDHKLYSVYENIVQNELRKLKTPYGRPYEILRLKTNRYGNEQLAAYTNSLIVNNTIYVPLFQIKEDRDALETWRKAMPGYTVKGFEFVLKEEPILSKEMNERYKSGYGWNSGDALHCRVRAVWDSEMIFITTKRIEKIVDSKNRNIVYTTIIDYSKQGLVKDKTKLSWRVLGESNWTIAQMTSTVENPTYFLYKIPYHKKGATIEYYISTESNSGRKETMPKTAPLGTYQFNIE